MIRKAITISHFVAITAIFAAPAHAMLTERERVRSIELRLADAADDLCSERGRSVGCAGTVALSDSKTKNAWSYGHSIVVTKGMVQFTSDDELAFVIAHEMAHNIAGNGIGKVEELRADEMGSYLIAQSGFDVASSVKILKRTSRSIFIANTHPTNRRRIVNILSIINKGMRLKNNYIKTVFSDIYVMNRSVLSVNKKIINKNSIKMGLDYPIFRGALVSSVSLREVQFLRVDLKVNANRPEVRFAGRELHDAIQASAEYDNRECCALADSSGGRRPVILAAMQNELAPRLPYVITHSQFN